MIKFNTTKSELTLIVKIARRAQAMNPVVDFQSCVMDMDATNSNGNPLRFADLLASDDFNFAHDVFGIMRHLDRTTGELRDCFSPRFSIPQNAFA